MLDNTELNDKLVSELREIAKTYGVEDAETLRKQDLITRIKEQQTLPTPVTPEIPNTIVAESSADKPKKRARSVKSKQPEKAVEKTHDVGLFAHPADNLSVAPQNTPTADPVI